VKKIRNRHWFVLYTATNGLNTLNGHMIVALVSDEKLTIDNFNELIRMAKENCNKGETVVIQNFIEMK